jgi:hypothetical protein
MTAARNGGIFGLRPMKTKSDDAIIGMETQAFINPSEYHAPETSCD